MRKGIVWWVGTSALLLGSACAVQDSQEEAIETATSASGLACMSWSPIQQGTVTIADNGFGIVADGNFSAPFQVGDGYAFKISHQGIGNCPYEQVKIFAHYVQGGPETELLPLRFVTMPDGSRIWVYKPDTASTAFNITNKIKGPPGSTCTFMTMTCTTGY